MTMDDYIKRKDAVDAFERVVHHDAICKAVREEIDEIPADADVVKVVRCRDCTNWCVVIRAVDGLECGYCDKTKEKTKEEFFCANGKRKEGKG